MFLMASNSNLENQFWFRKQVRKDRKKTENKITLR